MSESSVSEQDRQQLLKLNDSDFIDSYATAYHLTDQACQSHYNYWEVIRACQDHIGGKKPIPVEELQRRGLGWVYNFNYGKARAKIEKGVAESTAKISSALAMGYATLRIAKKEDAKDPILSALLEPEKRGMISAAIGCSLCSTLASETRLSGWLNEVEYPSYAFGYAALVFNQYDWMPDAIHPLDIAFKPDTKPSDIQTWILFDVLEAKDLYRKWVLAKNEKAKHEVETNGKKITLTSSGWNLEGLESCLLRAFKGKLHENKTPESWKEVLPLYERNPSYCIANTESVVIAKIFYKELNGTLTESYIPYSSAWQMTTNKSPQVTTKDGTRVNVPEQNENAVAHLLYKKNHGEYDQKKWIHLVRDSGFAIDSGTIQSLKGIASYSVEDSIRYNRQRNGLNNKAHFAGSPYFEQPTGQATEKFKLTVSQGYIILPSSHRMVERQPVFDLSSHINILRFEEGEFNRDTQQFDATIQGRLTSRPNKGEVQRVTEEVEFTDSAKNNIKFRDYAAVFLAVLKRLKDTECKKGDPGYEGKNRFFDNMRKQLSWLVETDEDISKLLEAIDTFVIEPVTTNIETITIAIQMAETPFARNRLKRMLLLAKGLPIEEVNLAVPMIADKFTNMQDERIATFENDMFFTTNEVVLSQTDDDIVHLKVHISKCQRVIQGAQQNALSPIDAFKYLENNLAHGMMHLQKLGQDPIHNQAAQEFGAELEWLMKAKNQIRQIAEQMLQQQAEQAGQIPVDPKTQAQIASDAARAQADTDRKNWLAEQRTGQREKQIEMDYTLREKKQDQEHQQKLAKIQQDGQQP